ncbi:uncharacterized protein LOC110108961 [Dendrobium catenatum]|uniref:uncharacterized protein LOC110108961 n=1 Tax=Dendrobium catenatum TaxID=906689 RepID=UPI0009F2F454|nr:uncharacterized protein LOC110108961 [Dendrobium catenatum]
MVVLISKTDNANMPSKFRPVSLCQSFYKIVAKVLINRLKLVLSSIISEQQGAFVLRRSISSHGMLAQEMMCKFKCSTQKSRLMALKVDMDVSLGLDLHFLLMGVEPSGLMPRAISDKGARCDRICLFSVLNYYPKLFANRINDIRIIGLLDDYCDWTGHRINCGKSAILFNKKCPNSKKRMLAKLMEYRKVNSLEYLGLPLVMRKLVAAYFAKVMKAAQEKMNVCEKKQLSVAGRALMINTSLLSIPIYLMTHTVIPNGVLNSIERLVGRFLWQNDPNSRGMHYVGWKELCKPKNQGGLKLHDLLVWKCALRARVVWDLLQHPDSSLYKFFFTNIGMRLWDNTQGKNISITWKVNQDGARALQPILRWNIGNGIHIDVLQEWILDRNIAKWPTFVNVDEWNEDMIKRCFGNIMAERILAIEVCNDTHVDNPELIHARMDMTVTAMAYNLKLHPRERFFW